MIDGLLLGVGCAPAESTSVPLAENDHNAPSATFSLPSRLSFLLGRGLESSARKRRSFAAASPD